MKKHIIPLLLCLLTLSIVSCKKEVKKEGDKATTEAPKKQAAFSLQNATHSIQWIAYKTTEKVPVKGQFKKINILNSGEGNTAKEAINNAEFSIPVSSIFTADSGRDFKIRKFFFGAMDNTDLLSGKLVLENDSIGHVNLTMNGLTNKVPFNYTLNGKSFNLIGKMDVLAWKAEKALDSLNTICKELHKGADGVSKTWNDVALQVTTSFK